MDLGLIELHSSKRRWRLTMEPSYREMTDRGTTKAYHKGIHLEFRDDFAAKVDQSTGDLVAGVLVPMEKLTEGFKDRRGRSRSRLVLGREAKRLGISPREIIDFMLLKHRDSLGISWQILGPDRQVLPIAAVQPKLGSGHGADNENAVGDEAFLRVIREEPKFYWCGLCDLEVPGRGITGHRKKKEHVAAYEAKLAEEAELVAAV